MVVPEVPLRRLPVDEDLEAVEAAAPREVLSSLVRHGTVSTPYLIALGLLQHQNTVY